MVESSATVSVPPPSSSEHDERARGSRSAKTRAPIRRRRCGECVVSFIELALTGSRAIFYGYDKRHGWSENTGKILHKQQQE